jgi:hypothetical protein
MSPKLPNKHRQINNNNFKECWEIIKLGLEKKKKLKGKRK